MPNEINVDTQNETATLQFVDRVGELTPPPAGATVSWRSDNPAVATVTPHADNQLVADVAPQGAGTVNVVASVSGATEPDGTPFPDASAALQVDPGAAVGDRVTLS